MTLATLGLIVVVPIGSVVALLIWFEDFGPVFFRQVRVGKAGRHFRIWKFRTMLVDSPSRGEQLTVGHDPRVTRIGVWIRRYKVDELPQLLNVLVGDMSLVGPRPEVPRYVEMYSPEQRKVLELTPGMTDEASIRFRDESATLAQQSDPEQYYIRALLPEKIRINLEYADRSSVLTDGGVILRTIGALVGVSRND